MITYEDLKNALKHNRSVRRFQEDKRIDIDTLEKLVDLTRLCASAANRQPIKYRLVVDRDICSEIFSCLAWAGYYKDWDGPAVGERPTAYLIQCLDTDIANDCLCDDGLQLEAITLGATTFGLSCCIIKAFNGLKLAKIINIDGHFKPLYVLALGYPAEKVTLVDMSKTNDYRYYRDANSTQCVPKRALSDIIF